jgi:hypothetical protein
MWLSRPWSAASTTVMASLVVSRKPCHVGLKAGCALTMLPAIWGLGGGGVLVAVETTREVAIE